MKALNLTIMGLALILSQAVFAEIKYSGTAGLGFMIANGEEQSGKFREYEDVKDGILGNIGFRYDNPENNYYMYFKAKDIAREHQSYKFKGGKYKNYKYALKYNQIYHKNSLNAKTFYDGVGTDTLDYTATDRAKNTDSSVVWTIPEHTDNWNKFDYEIKRKDMGVDVELSLDSPFFVAMGTNQVTVKGLKPMGQPQGVYGDRKGVQTSAFGQVVEFPATIDYKTVNAYVEGGYRGKDYFFSVKGLTSAFTNENLWLKKRLPYVTTKKVMETSSLAPPSNYMDVSVKGAIYDLPLHSTLVLTGSNAAITNSIDLEKTIIGAQSGTATTTPDYGVKPLAINHEKFEGNIVYQSAGLVLSSAPMTDMDTKLYYKFFDKKNDSTKIEYSDPSRTDLDPYENEHFGYTKNNLGLDVGYKLPADTKAFVGYEHKNVARDDRLDAEKTVDSIAYLKLKNSSLEMLTSKIGYQTLTRTSEFKHDSTGTGPTDAAYFHRYMRRFDATDKKEQKYSIGFDIFPMENVDVMLEYAMAKNTYGQTVLGRLNDTRAQTYADIGYSKPGLFALNLFFEMEQETSVTKSRAATNSADPNATPTTTNYNWETNYKDKVMGYGVNLAVPVIDNKLDFESMYMYQNGNGSASFSAQNDVVTFTDIDALGDYKRTTVDAKFKYHVMDNLDSCLGYAFEKMSVEDYAYDGYKYLNPASTALLTGANADKDYSANLVYAMATYNF